MNTMTEYMDDNKHYIITRLFSLNSTSSCPDLCSGPGSQTLQKLTLGNAYVTVRRLMRASDSEKPPRVVTFLTELTHFHAG